VARKPRADGQRNRERLLEVAKQAFAEVGPDVSLEEIARRAEVGIGTLYRHFPTRDAIVSAVYSRELAQLAAAVPRLMQTLRPAEALHEWMRMLVDYIATKKVIAAALSTGQSGASELYAASGFQLTDALGELVASAAAKGEIRTDIDADDLLRGLVGFTYGAAAPGWRESALRLIDVLMDGMKPVR
jgi:AcrR family transcriptional regulator